jgi:hypothetical protein
MLGNILKAFDLFGFFNKTCSYCGLSKSGNFWEYDDFPGQFFCKKSCLNNHMKQYGNTQCDMCGKTCGLNTYYLVDDESIIFCKKGCADRYEWAEPCTNCDTIHGTRTYKDKGREFGSKQCKEQYLARERLSISLDKGD